MDQKLLLLINHDWTNPALDRFMAVMSSLDFWIPFFAVAILAVAIRAGFRGRAFLLVAGLCLAINDGVVANSLKHAVHRLRPHEALSGIRHIDLAHVNPRILALGKPLKIAISTSVPDTGQGRSFPSGHVIDTVTIATVVLLFYPRFGWISFLVPMIVGYSRVYVGSHWPSDVIASLLLGTATTILFVRLLNLVWRRYGDRILHRIHAAHPSLLAST